MYETKGTKQFFLIGYYIKGQIPSKHRMKSDTHYPDLRGLRCKYSHEPYPNDVLKPLMLYHLNFTELGQYQIYFKLASCVTVTKRNRHTLLPLLLASIPISAPAQMFVQQTDPAPSEPFPACPSPRLAQSSAQLTT